MLTTATSARRVATGIEHLLDRGNSMLDGARVGLVTHAAAVLPDLGHSLDALRAAGVNVRAVFGPEHGFRGTTQAGAAEHSAVDPATGLPVHDMYAVAGPALIDLLRAAGVDVIVVDLQHVGARFYTYESTLFDLIEAAAPAGVPLLVLDRPNPVGGKAVQGPVLDPALRSFVGRARIPVRHGMTMGELALLFADMLGTPRPEVVPMSGWMREIRFGRTGLPWVAPSPNIPTPATAICYPGTCLLEGTNVSVGRGTTVPFELCGAPWMDASLTRELRALDLPGVAFREATFSPTFDRHAGERLTGVQLHVSDENTFDPLWTVVAMLEVMLRRWPHAMEFQPAVFDRLAGTDRLRLALLAGTSSANVIAQWTAELASFRQLREAYLLYPDLDGPAPNPTEAP